MKLLAYLENLKFLFLILLVLFSSTNCTQATQKKATSSASQVGNILFTPPVGWQKLDQQGGVAFIPGDKPADKASCFIAILPGQDFTGNFREWFDSAVEKLNNTVKILSKGEVTESTDDKGVEVLYTSLAVQSSDGQVSYRLYVSAHPKNRVELLAYAAYSKEDFQKYNPIFQKFLESVEFANVVGTNSSNNNSNNSSNNSTPSNKAKPTGNGLTGLYVGTDSRQQFNPNTKLYDYIVRQVYYFFSPDGQVYNALPKGGTLDNFDFDQAKTADPDNFGYYQISNGQIQFQFSNRPQTPAVAFSNNQNSLQIGRIKLYPVSQFTNLRLNGNYSVKTFVNTSSGNNYGGVAGEKQIVFSQDGRFSQNGFVGFSGSSGGSGAATSSKTSGSGTYRIVDNTLELTYSDGQKARFTFFVYPENVNEPRPGLLIIDGAAYLLQK